MDKKKQSAIKLTITSATPENYARLEELQHNYLDVFRVGLEGEEFIQIVHDEKFWHAFLAWGSAGSASYDRDHFIGWHDSRRAECLSLIATNLKFMPRPGYHESEAGRRALQLVMEYLPDTWESLYGYKPLLAETRLEARSHLSGYYKADHWIKCSDKHPDHHPTVWLKELVPGARNMLRRNHLDGDDMDDAQNPSFGLLPIPTKLIKSLKEALDHVDDPRARSSYPIGSVLAIHFMAMICGRGNLQQITDFGKRLSHEQTVMLDLPFRKKHGIRMEPGYYVFYDLLPLVDMVEVVNILGQWLEDYQPLLPSVLGPKDPLILDTFRSMITNSSCFSKPTEKEQLELNQRIKPSREKPPPQSMQEKLMRPSILR